MCFDQPGQFDTFMDGVRRWNELNAQINDATNQFNGADVAALVDKLEKGEKLESPPSSMEGQDEPLKGEVPADLVRIVDMSREMRTLGAWLVEQEDSVKNKPWHP